MSCRLLRSSLSREQLGVITSQLVLKPTLPFNPYSKYREEPEPILFFLSHDDNTISLPYKFVEREFQTEPNVHLKHPKINLSFTGTLRDYQVPILKEVMEQIQRFGTSTLGIYPGAGKTILGACVSCYLGLMVAVLVPRTILIPQWKKTFEDFTDAKVWAVGEEEQPSSFNILIVLDERWQKVPEAIRRAVGYLIIDEAHMLCTPTRVSSLLAFQPRYILAETATLERDDDMHVMIYQLCGTHGVFRVDTRPFQVLKVCTGFRPERISDKKRLYHKLLESISTSSERNKLILDLVQANPNSIINIQTSLVEHTLQLYNDLKALNESVDYLCGTKKSYIDSRILVGTMSKIGVGFDQATSALNYQGRPFEIVIIVGDIKKYSKLVQVVGRGMRSDFPTIIHLVDNDPIFERHWKLSEKWYQKRSAKIITNKDRLSLTPSESSERWIKQKITRLKIIN